MHTDDRRTVSGCFLFADHGLTEAAEAILDRCPIRSYRKGELIYSRDCFERAVGVLLSGEAEVLKGRGVVLNTLSAGDSFGIAGLFTDDASLISLAANGLIICVLAFPLIGSQIIIGNFFQAIGKARLAIFLSLTRQMLFLLPFLLVLPRFWGQDGVWASLPLADVLSFIVTLLFIRRFLKYYRLKNRHYLVPGTGKA